MRVRNLDLDPTVGLDDGDGEARDAPLPSAAARPWDDGAILDETFAIAESW